MERRVRKATLKRSATFVNRTFLFVLGFAMVGLLAWQTVAVVQERAAASSTTAPADLAAERGAAYTDLFTLFHRTATEGNILTEATWYTPSLTEALFRYGDASSHQRDIANALIGVDRENILTFVVLLTSEVSDVRDIAVADVARVYDDEGRGYSVLGWTRLNPLSLRPGKNRQQEAGILLVSALADDGSSIWSNSSTNLSLRLEGIEQDSKLFTWRKELAEGANLF